MAQTTISHNWLRGAEWLLIALLGALVVGHFDAVFDGYTARWAGACFKVASGAWGGYRISRDIARIDPSVAQPYSEPLNFALLHIARAVIMAASIIGVCVAV